MPVFLVRRSLDTKLPAMLLSSSNWFLIAALTTYIVSTSQLHVLPPDTLLSFYNKDRESGGNSGSIGVTEIPTDHTTTQPHSLLVGLTHSHTLHEGLEVTENSPYCQYDDGTLTCDFSWTQQDVYVSSFLETSRPLQELFIKNVRLLKLSKSFCSTLILHHVEKVLTDEVSSHPACQQMTVELLNVTLDKLPVGVKSLHAADAKIASFILGETAEVVSVTDSKIQYLRTTSQNNRILIKLQNTSVERVENLQISGNSTLLSYNCSIGNLPENGITINTTGNVFDGIIFPRDGAMNNGIIIMGGADLVLGDITGKVHIKVPVSLTGKQSNQGTYIHEGFLANSSRFLDPCLMSANSYENYCSDTSHLILIFLIFSVFLNITQILFDQPGKFIKNLIQGRMNSRLTYTETSVKEDDCDSVQSHEKPLLNDDYLLARRISSLDTLHIRRVSVVDSKAGEVHTVARVVPRDPQVEERHAQVIQKPHRPEHSSGRIRKRSLQKHNFWKAHKAPRHPLKRSVTLGANDIKYFATRRDSIPDHQSGNNAEYPMTDMGNPMQSNMKQAE